MNEQAKEKARAAGVKWYVDEQIHVLEEVVRLTQNGNAMSAKAFESFEGIEMQFFFFFFEEEYFITDGVKDSLKAQIFGLEEKGQKHLETLYEYRKRNPDYKRYVRY